MRSLFLVLSLLASVAASAANTLRFDPPDPTSRTPVLALIQLPAATCAVQTTTVTRTGQFLNIELSTGSLCTPMNIPPSGVEVAADLGLLPAGVYHVSVGSGPILLSLAEGTLVVRDASPAFEVQPNALSSPTEPVHLVGRNVVSCLSGIACEHIDVRFGDLAAEVISTSPSEIVVKPPVTLQPGVYDVTISRTNSVLRAAAAFHIGPPDEAFYERVLFPVFFSGPGAFGSDWRTNATLYNGNAFPWFAPQPSIFGRSCFPPCDVTPPSRATVTGSGPSMPSGVVEWAPRQSAANADFGLRIVDLSRNAQDLGTEVPVVRENDLYDRTFQLLAVPADARYRVTLRLYDLDGPRTFLVRVYAMGALTAPFVEREVRLASDATLRGGGFAAVNDLFAGTPAGSYRVEIVPLTESGVGRHDTGVKSAWGFVSVTNNDTQHVTVISPQ